MHSGTCLFAPNEESDARASGRAQKTAIDLFAGAGGVTAGLRKAHFEVLAAVEIDPEACATYAANHRNVLLKRADILTVDPDEMRAELGMRPGDLTLLGACAPCQGFSSIGARRPNDPPKRSCAGGVAICRNVPSGLRRIRKRAEPQARPAVRGILSTAASARVRRGGSLIVDAADYGVAQRQRRLVALAAIGVPDDSVPFLMAPRPGSERTPIEVAWEGLVPIDSGGDPLHTTPNHPLEVLTRIKAIPANGGSRSDLPESLRLRCHESRSPCQTLTRRFLKFTRLHQSGFYKRHCHISPKDVFACVGADDHSIHGNIVAIVHACQFFFVANHDWLRVSSFSGHDNL